MNHTLSTKDHEGIIFFFSRQNDRRCFIQQFVWCVAFQQLWRGLHKGASICTIIDLAQKTFWRHACLSSFIPGTHQSGGESARRTKSLNKRLTASINSASHIPPVRCPGCPQILILILWTMWGFLCPWLSSLFLSPWLHLYFIVVILQIETRGTRSDSYLSCLGRCTPSWVQTHLYLDTWLISDTVSSLARPVSLGSRCCFLILASSWVPRNEYEMSLFSFSSLISFYQSFVVFLV